MIQLASSFVISDEREIGIQQFVVTAMRYGDVNAIIREFDHSNRSTELFFASLRADNSKGARKIGKKLIIVLDGGKSYELRRDARQC